MSRPVNRSGRRAALDVAWLASLVVLLAALGGCGGGGPPGGVLLIGIDTLRADHLGCYGYARPTSPRIDAFAAESVLFEQAISQSNWTLPAFASIMTGVLPSRHKAGDGKNCLTNPCGALGPELPTLAQLFSEAGHRTMSWVSNGFVDVPVGLGRGFEQTLQMIRGDLAVDAAVAWLTEHRDEPFFAFVHVIEPHSPYLPPNEDRALFVDPGYRGSETGEAVAMLNPTWDDADRRHVVDLYDAEVHWTDRLVGRLLDALERLDLGSRTLVVLVSDHGEELFDHARIGHGHTMYDELLHVPLIVRFPGARAPRRVATQVRTMDLFPTILDAMGRPVPAGTDATSLLNAARGYAVDPECRTAIAEFSYREPEQKAVRQPPEKLILSLDRNRPLLFDLAVDPRERTDRAAVAPERVAALRRTLDRPDDDATPGFYLSARGGVRTQRIRIRLGAPGARIVEGVVRHGEAEDVVSVAPDGRAATIDLVLDDPADVDVVWLAMSPIVDQLRIESVTLGDAPFPPARIVVGGAPAKGDFAFPAVIPAVRVAGGPIEPPAPAFDGEVRLAVQALTVSKRPTISIDPETRERLRMLGYGD